MSAQEHEGAVQSRFERPDRGGSGGEAETALEQREDHQRELLGIGVGAQRTGTVIDVDGGRTGVAVIAA